MTGVIVSYIPPFLIIPTVLDSFRASGDLFVLEVEGKLLLVCTYVRTSISIGTVYYLLLEGRNRTKRLPLRSYLPDVQKGTQIGSHYCTRVPASGNDTTTYKFCLFLEPHSRILTYMYTGTSIRR